MKKSFWLIIVFFQFIQPMERERKHGNGFNGFDNSGLYSLIENYIKSSIKKRELAKEIEDYQYVKELSLEFTRLISNEVGVINCGQSLLKALAYHEMLISEFSQNFLKKLAQQYILYRVGYLLMENDNLDGLVNSGDSNIPIFGATNGLDASEQNSKVVAQIEFDTIPSCSSFSSSCEYLAVGFSDGRVSIVDLRKATPEYLEIAGMGSVPALRVSLLHEGKMLIVYRSDGSLIIFRIRGEKGRLGSAELIQNIDAKGDAYLRVNFSEVIFQTYKDKYLVLCAQNSFLRIYDLITGKVCWQNLLRCKDKIYSICWKPSGDLFLSTNKKIVKHFGLQKIKHIRDIKELLMKEYLFNFVRNKVGFDEDYGITPEIFFSKLPKSDADSWQNVLNDHQDNKDRTLNFHGNEFHGSNIIYEKYSPQIDLMKDFCIDLSFERVQKPCLRMFLINFLFHLGLELLQQIP